jgi:ubiquinone/menaquinone biosynthesis C-methylase UbiE
MPWKYTDEYYKNYTRDTWDECAAEYLPVLGNLMPFQRQLLDHLRPSPGLKVLDVATGPGEPAMTLAAMVSPSGSVLGIDLSSKMIDVARRNAAKRVLKNVEFKVMDAEKMPLKPGTFDLTVSTFGFQIITNPEKAAAEMLRVLRPGGRIGLTVWSTGDRIPALHVMVEPMLDFAEPDETGYLPTPYELGGPGQLTHMIEEVGFAHAEEIRVQGEWRAPSEEAYLKMLVDGTPLGHSMKEEEPDAQKQILTRTRANISKWRASSGEVRIPAECVLVIGSKPREKRGATRRSKRPAAKARTVPAPRKKGRRR